MAKTLTVHVTKFVELDEDATKQIIVEFLAWATQGPQPYLDDERSANLNGERDYSHDDLVAAWIAVR